MFLNGPIPGALIEKELDTSEAQAGATAIFIGKVRADKVKSSVVRAIEFTAQQNIANKTAVEIIEGCKKEKGVLNAEIWHSLGNVLSGQPCFLVIVNSKHRKESFEALQWIVDEVKKQCPIFGKEIFEDGRYQWKKNKETISF